MKRAFWVLAFAACSGSSSTGGIDAGTASDGASAADGATTDGAAPADADVCADGGLAAATDRTCLVPADCALVTHFDCCGNIRLAVKKGTESAYDAAESAYQTCHPCPPRGCTHPDRAEDGTTPQQGQSIVAICNAGRCTSLVQ